MDELITVCRDCWYEKCQPSPNVERVGFRTFSKILLEQNCKVLIVGILPFKKEVNPPLANGVLALNNIMPIIDKVSVLIFDNEKLLKQYDGEWRKINVHIIQTVDYIINLLVKYNTDNYFLDDGDQISVSNILFEQNNIWFGTEEFITRENPEFNLGGLYRYDRKINWKRFSEYEDLSGSGIFSLEITGNYIWSSVYKFDLESKSVQGMGINLINRNTLETKRILNDLIPDTVFCLHFDGKNMWLGTNDGIRQINFRNNILPDFS